MEMTAKKYIKETKKEKKEWFDEECKTELRSRRKLRLKMLEEGTEEAKNKFEEQSRKTKMMLRNKKRKHYEKVLEQIEENYRNNDIRNLYQGVKNERRGEAYVLTEKKTKYERTEEYQEGRFLKVETNTGKKYEFEGVEQFTYLGSIFSRKPNIGEEIEARIMAGNECVAGSRRILRNKNISRQTKIRLAQDQDKHMSLMGLAEEATCRFCSEEEETAVHVLCQCEGLAKLRFLILGEENPSASSYTEAPLSRLWSLMQRTQLDRIRLYRTVIRPIVTYCASEKWALNKSEQITLEGRHPLSSRVTSKVVDFLPLFCKAIPGLLNDVVIYLIAMRNLGLKYHFGKLHNFSPFTMISSHYICPV
ncbi:hypothetical protein NQ315_013683 [Exocentrus adspersus]|uniref:Reverse transcriptase n=1 Tax=Exocentrus adspersus TaxID=1586481 RepID=A0AAV8W3K0_9CUCU|nr:hypothetical protein NQ315_013683 [Exocentrus adspersus]